MWSMLDGMLVLNKGERVEVSRAGLRWLPKEPAVCHHMDEPGNCMLNKISQARKTNTIQCYLNVESHKTLNS